jgi:hypothetical protein
MSTDIKESILKYSNTLTLISLIIIFILTAALLIKLKFKLDKAAYILLIVQVIAVSSKILVN